MAIILKYKLNIRLYINYTNLNSRNGDIKQIGFSVVAKLFLIVAQTAGIFLSYWASLAYIEDGELYHLIVLVLPIFLFSAIGLWYTFKFRLILTDNYIENKGLLRTTKLYYDKVSHVYLYDNEMVLKGGGKKIRITSDLQDQKVVINQLLQVLSDKPKIEIKGDKKTIEAFKAKKQSL